jgi:hypothetical protein
MSRVGHCVSDQSTANGEAYWEGLALAGAALGDVVDTGTGRGETAGRSATITSTAGIWPTEPGSPAQKAMLKSLR